MSGIQIWLADTPGTSQTTGYPTTNSLNQYQTVQRPNPLKKLVQGLAHPDSTVTVTLVGGPGNGTLPPVSTLRWGPGMTAFAAEAVVEMVPQAGWRRVRVDAVRPGAGAAGANLRTVREGWLYFPPAMETLDYDLDGNLISDARWTYGWDGENRLIWMEEKVIPGNGIRPARQRLEFGYDGQSRRVVKRVLQKVSETSSWSLRQERRFLYDGWNMIAEIDISIASGTPRLHRTYAWGLDASGTLTGAGGVGGLLLTSHHTPQAGGGTQVTTLAPLYDFNGNVLAYADVATSTITHRMEYDPFGQELSLDTLLPGEGAAEAPRFRFSTKYTDGETGLVYYGFRYYSTDHGRWSSPDPLSDFAFASNVRGDQLHGRGMVPDLNLYVFISNEPIGRYDFLGLIGSGIPIPNSNNFEIRNPITGDVYPYGLTLPLEECPCCDWDEFDKVVAGQERVIEQLTDVINEGEDISLYDSHVRAGSPGANGIRSSTYTSVGSCVSGCLDAAENEFIAILDGARFLFLAESAASMERRRSQRFLDCLKKVSAGCSRWGMRISSY